MGGLNNSVARVRVSRFLFVALAVLVVAPSVAEACHLATPKNPGLFYDDPLVIYARAQSSSSGPVLTTNPAEGGASSYNVFDAASGAPTVLSSLAGQPAPQVATPFRLTPPLDRVYWLNLSRPVTGTFYWTTTGASSTGRENSYFRFELLLNNQRVGGDECAIPLSTSTATWNAVHVRFRPEIRSIGPGDVLALRITRFNGLTDFQVGTDGNHQTSFEFRTYARDPLTSNLYLEGRRLDGLPRPSSEGESSGSQAPAAPSALLLLPALGLLARGRGARAALLTMVLVALALGGCVGSPQPAPNAYESGSNTPQPTLIANYTRNDTLKRQEIGAVQGHVRNDLNLSLRAANVALVGTKLSTSTDASGRFEFPNVSAGTYLLRVDKSGHESLEQKIQVKEGERLQLDILLVRVRGPSGGSTPHSHDNWGEATSKVIWEDDFGPFGVVWLPPANVAACPYYASPRCEGAIPIDPLTPVPPGAITLEIKLTWVPTAVGVKEMGIRITTTRQLDADQFYTPRGPGEPFRIQFFPDEADPGHQTFTQWVVYAYTTSTAKLENVVYPAVTPYSGKVHLEATAHKGVVPYEPRHNNRWADATQMDLFAAAPRGPGNCNPPCDYPPTSVSSSNSWSVGPGLWVPPGTKEIVGTLSWSNPGVPVGGTAWSVVYKSADSPNARPIWKTPTKVTTSAGKIEFTIVPKAEELDQFYQTASNWAFAPDDGLQPTCPVFTGGVNCFSPNTGAGTSWLLSATAFRDPLWVPPDDGLGLSVKK